MTTNNFTRQTALIVIDVQNDYFANGAYPQWQVDEALAQTLLCVEKAKQQSIPVILVQHLADNSQGDAPFFNPGTLGVEIHPALLKAAPDAPIITKHFADSFDNTPLADILRKRHITDVLLCGIMTQNCVTHTAISKSAEAYAVSVIADACAAPSQMVHFIALSALSRRVTLINSTEW